MSILVSDIPGRLDKMRWSAFALLSGSVLFTNVLTVAEAQTKAGAESLSFVGQTSSASSTAMELFGCIAPLPGGYILRTDIQPFHFYRADGRGTIGVKPHEPLDQSELEILNEEIDPPLTIVEVTIPKEPIRSRTSITIIHDGKTEMSIWGPDVVWAVNMARRCAQKSKQQN